MEAATGDATLAIVVAAATAVGRGVGAVVTPAITARVKRRREKQQIAQGAQAADPDRKEAARLVDEELRDSTQVIGDAVYQGRRWPPQRSLWGS